MAVNGMQIVKNGSSVITNPELGNGFLTRPSGRLGPATKEEEPHFIVRVYQALVKLTHRPVSFVQEDHRLRISEQEATHNPGLFRAVVAWLLMWLLAMR